MAETIERPRAGNATARRLAWAYFGLILVITGAGILLLWLTRDAARNEVYALESFPIEVIDRIQFVAVAGLGALILGKQPWNRLGWIFCLMGFGFPWVDFAEAYARYALETNPGTLPGGTFFAWTTNWIWGLTIFLLPATFVLFPDGRPPSPRWRAVTVLSYACVIYATGVTMFFDKEIDGFPGVANPTNMGTDVSPDDLVGPVFLLFLALLVAGAVSLVIRFRRAGAEQRAQLKWFLYAAALFCLYMTMTIVFETQGVANIVGGVVASVGLTAAVAIAILKYRLYDIDVVINKTIVFGALAAFITGIYVAIVVGIGALLGSSDEPNLALSIAATAIVAIAFSPVKERTQRFANRLVYGRRATPYEALARFTEEVASSYETDKVAPAMAQTIVNATGAERAEVWLALDHTLVRAAAEPDHGETPEAVALDEDMEVGSIARADVTSPVIHNDELLGALALTKKRGEQATAWDDKLLRDLASQAGIVLRNSRLTAELRARLDQITRTAQEIRESRRRIVATQDRARRALERDIHDGAQQHLVALAVKLNLAKTMAQKKPERAGAMLVQLRDDAEDALDTLDELARGIYPPVLAERGIANAIESRAGKAPFGVAVTDATATRFDPHVEAAIYFCILEALQNVAKYANATAATVTLAETDSDLTFAVTDDGAGFDPTTTDYGTGVQGMADRLAAVGGTIEITSAPGKGTTVTGRVPVHAKELVS